MAPLPAPPSVRPPDPVPAPLRRRADLRGIRFGAPFTPPQDSKCSWLVVTALAKASAAQKKTIHAAYGKKDKKSVASVKKVYADLGLQAEFETYEGESYAKLTAAIGEQKLLPAEVFTAFLKKIYKRAK